MISVPLFYLNVQLETKGSVFKDKRVIYIPAKLNVLRMIKIKIVIG